METYGSRRADYKFGSSAYALNDIEEKKWPIQRLSLIYLSRLLSQVK
jgi:hypothetical protein